MAEPRSLNYFTAYCTQADQVSVSLGDQFRSGILKALMDKLPKPDKRYNLT